MMSRFAPRLPALLLAALYLAAPAGVFGVRACSHHDAAMAEAHSDAAGHGGHAHHHGDGGGAEPLVHEGHEEHEEHGGCACIGACSPASMLALPPPAVSGQVAVAGVSVAAMPVAGDVVFAHLLPYVLPFAVGPPVSIG
jgi:hypothetical protein